MTSHHITKVNAIKRLSRIANRNCKLIEMNLHKLEADLIKHTCMQKERIEPTQQAISSPC